MGAITNTIKSLGGLAYLKKALEGNISWIIKSHEATSFNGSSKYRTVFGKWAEAYPETTGYLLPTLKNADTIIRSKDIKQCLKSNIEYLKSLFHQEGYFDSGDGNIFVFDNSQILLGLLLTEDLNDGIKELTYKNYSWLLKNISPDGVFINYNYKKNYNPSYYARIAWALLLFEKKNGLNHNQKTKTLLSYITSLQKENKHFKNASFDGSQKSFTHTIIYSYRGLWESYHLLEKTNVLDRLYNDVLEIVTNLNLSKKSFYGIYDDKWQTKTIALCCAGNAQLAILLLSMYEYRSNPVFLEVIKQLLRPLLKAQKKPHFFNTGGIPSSIPTWGPYQRFKYTNWTQKFFSDALIRLIKTQELPVDL